MKYNRASERKIAEEIKNKGVRASPPFPTLGYETSSVPVPPRSIPITVACFPPVIPSPSPTLMPPVTGRGTGDRRPPYLLVPIDHLPR